ncbi:phospholipase A2 [Streptosporangium sp. NPDC049248]|uniref:phospholipase A2 n=1 Tax=Streptosporangium sp. NPDC049248 TaxID=3155651 RepID=UPI00342DAC6F
MRFLEVTSDGVITPGEGDDPADPGPAPKDLWPGRPEPETGVWITSATDLDTDGLLTTRSHSAGQRIDLTHPNEKVLGPNWRLEPLDGVLGKRLKDNSASGYIQINETTGTSSLRFLADPANPGTFTATEGGTVVKNGDGTFTHTADTGLSYTWSNIGSDYLITKMGNADTGMTLITYDAQGRVGQITQPLTPQDDCSLANATGCSSATFNYATSTTATSSVFGDVTGQLKAISYDAAGDTASVTAITYRYDNLTRLREVRDDRQIDGDPVKTWTYSYDSAGNITQLDTPSEGKWTLTYSAAGKLATATQPPTLRAAAASCTYAADYMLYGRCSTKVDILKGSGYEYRTPFWKSTLTGGSVYGITNDGCSAPLIGDKPKSWINFKSACDAHDYGYGLIRNTTQPQSSTLRGLPRSKRPSVDSAFHTIMTKRICAALKGIYGVPGTRREVCNDYADLFYRGVRAKGDGFL